MRATAYAPVFLSENLSMKIDKRTVFVPQQELQDTKPTDVRVMHPDTPGATVSLYHLLSLMGTEMGTDGEKQVIAFLVQNTVNNEGGEGGENPFQAGQYLKRLQSAAIAVDIYTHYRIQADAVSLRNWAKIQLEPRSGC